MIKTAKIYSEVDKQLTEWHIKLETETDEGDNEHTAYIARYGDEALRFSPNSTEAELTAAIEQHNAEKADK